MALAWVGGSVERGVVGGRVGLGCGRVCLGCGRVSLSGGRVGRGRIGVVVGIDGLVLIKVGVNGDVFRSLVRVGGRGMVVVSTAAGMARLVPHGGRSPRLVYILLGSLGKANRY